jgi:AraC-like DNA-binding protein
MSRFAQLRKAAQALPMETYAVDRPVDEKGQYRLELAADFPFAIKRLRFAAALPPTPLTWHTYLEIFLLLSSKCRIQMGDGVADLEQGDILLVNNRKLHRVAQFPGPAAEAIIIRFLPEMAMGVVSSATDHLLFLPFYYQAEGEPHILRHGEPASRAVCVALEGLFDCYTQTESPYGRTGSRAYFMELLHHLARYFRAAEHLAEKFARQQTKTNRLRKLFEYIGQNYAAKISLAEASTIAGLSMPRFNFVFKKATGMTLVAYLTQVRLAQAAHLLGTTDQSIAEIADQVGFADQSYFDRRFRRHFGRTPRSFRLKAGGLEG